MHCKKDGRLVSIIIRTKNEERWISQCLRAVFSQDYQPFEVILVDNQSTDFTLQKASAFDVKIVKIERFFPGEAINVGIRNSKGNILVCISGHCIPTSTDWLKNLVKGLEDPKVAGVYGRQEPLSFTPDIDKRDLITVFGLDGRRQKRDSFFHNANSAFRREVWEKFPFDEKVTNIEDRVWGEEVISKGYEIVYEPEASVFHFHGIHHSGDPTRCENVVKILESLSAGQGKVVAKARQPEAVPPEVVAIIPITGAIQQCGSKKLIEYTIARAKEARSISRVFVSTDNEDLAKLAISCGAEAPFLRPKELCGPGVLVGDILSHALSELEKVKVYPDALACLTASYPFRKKGFLDYLVAQFFREGLDTLLPVQEEGRSAWFRNNTSIEVVSDLRPRQTKSDHLYISLLGLGCITLPQFLRDKKVIGKNLGVQVVKDRFSQLELRDESSFEIAQEVIDKFFAKNEAWTSLEPTVSTVPSAEEIRQSSAFSL